MGYNTIPYFLRSANKNIFAYCPAPVCATALGYGGTIISGGFVINGVKVITTGSNIFGTPVSDSDWGKAVVMLPVDMLGLGITKGGLIPILGADETERIGAMLARGASAERATAGETIRQAVRGNAGFWKIGGGGGMTAVLNKITASLVGKYKNLQCKEFASDLRKILNKEGIGYKEIFIRSNSKFLSSTDARKIWGNDVISTNGEHYATRVGDIIYDNVHPQGISIKGFKDDIGITEYIKGFKEIIGLN